MKVRLLICFSMLHVIQIHSEDVLISKHKNTENVCQSDGSSCQSETEAKERLVMDWIRNLRNKTFNFGCATTEIDKNKMGDPIFSIVSCDDEGALWMYKYTGGKGPRKIFKGNGKLSFTRQVTPPHGYDYGMKSGLCLKISDEILHIEGSFNDKGLLHGEAEVLYKNGKLTRGNFWMGIFNGMARNYEPDIDPESNRERPEKRLANVVSFSNGKKVGPTWTFLHNGISIYDDKSSGESTLIFVPPEPLKPTSKENRNRTQEFLNDYDEREREFLVEHLGPEGLEFFNTSSDDQNSQNLMKSLTKNFKTIFFGKIDEDNMVIGAQKVEKFESKFNFDMCIMEVTGEAGGDPFDFDVLSSSQMSAVKAKLSRFFDIVANDKVDLTTRFTHPEELPDQQLAIKIFSNLRQNGSYYVMDCPYDPRNQVRAFFDGKLNENGLFDGKSSLRIYSDVRSENSNFKNSDSEYLLFDQLSASSYPDERLVMHITGDFVEGKLVGMAKLGFTDSSYIEGLVTENTFHGVYRMFTKSFSHGAKRRRYTSEALEYSTKVEHNSLAGIPTFSIEVTQVGVFKNGFQDGPMWKFLIGGSFMFGIVKSDTESLDVFTTDDGVYISSDLTNGFAGKFQDGKMVSSQAGKVEGQTEIDQIRAPVVTKIQDTVFRHCPDADGTFTDPLISDPVEDEMVYVGPSNISATVGQGLFAKKDLPRGTFVAYFGGRLLKQEEWEKMELFDPEYWRPLETHVVYLPDELGKDLTKYRATLGHKINHSFLNPNCKFVEQFHPRFGMIPAVWTLVNVAENTELICNYDFKFHNALPWYQEMWRKELDFDNVEGPIGERGPKNPSGSRISPMLVNSEIYRNFVEYAINELKLDPFV